MAAGYDVIVIGAGVSGMYQLHRLCGLGLRVRVFEAGDGVGGTSPVLVRPQSARKGLQPGSAQWPGSISCDHAAGR